MNNVAESNDHELDSREGDDNSVIEVIPDSDACAGTPAKKPAVTFFSK
jgi:hypothetical protein